MAISKAERKRNQAARRRERESTRRDKFMSSAAHAAGAYAGQKFFAGMTTPGTDSFPIQYTLGIAAVVFDMSRRPASGLTARALNLMEGAAVGQLAVMGYQSATPLFSAP
jgi:hypothetical protein